MRGSAAWSSAMSAAAANTSAASATPADELVALLGWPAVRSTPTLVERWPGPAASGGLLLQLATGAATDSSADSASISWSFSAGDSGCEGDGRAMSLPWAPAAARSASDAAALTAALLDAETALLLVRSGSAAAGDVAPAAATLSLLLVGRHGRKVVGEGLGSGVPWGLCGT